MIFYKKHKRREKPRYKKILRARENVLNKKKILELKKKKWKIFQFHYTKKLKFFKVYKALDQKRYTVARKAKKGVSYSKRYRDTLNAIRNFKLFYGSYKKHYFKKIITQILKKHKRIKNCNLNILFLSKIESRLDVVLFRSKFCGSILLARQIIKHKKIKVNNQIVKSKSFLLKPGDIINVDKCMFLKLKNILKQNKKKNPTWPPTPRHLYINYKTLQIIFGNPMNENFSSSLTFNLKLEKVLLNYIKTQ